MKTLRNILGIVLLLAFLIANANTAVHQTNTLEPPIERQSNQVEAYVLRNQLHINFDNSPAKQVDIEVYDLTGKRVDTHQLEATGSVKYTTSFKTILANGIYLIKIQVDGETHVKKVQKK